MLNVPLCSLATCRCRFAFLTNKSHTTDCRPVWNKRVKPLSGVRSTLTYPTPDSGLTLPLDCKSVRRDISSTTSRRGRCGAADDSTGRWTTTDSSTTH